MCENWKNKPLREFCRFVSGSGFPENLQGMGNGELPFYKVSDMSSPGNERFLFKSNNYVSRELARQRGWKTAPVNAVAFAKVGAALLLNRRRQLSAESIIDNNMVAVVANEFSTNEWLYWQLLRVDFANFVQDGALPSINQRQLGDIPIPRVIAAEATKISEILDTLDTTIRETETIIAKLKAVKQGLLHDLLTRGLDENGELRPPQSEAPHLYKDSSLGWIPRQWEQTVLANLVNPSRPIVYGILMPGYGFPGGVPVVKVKDIKNGTISLDNLLLTSPQIDREYHRSRLIPGDLLFSIRGTVGRSAFVPNELNGANITQDTARISILETDQRIIKYYLTMPTPSQFINTHTIGVAVKGINLRDVRKIPMPLMPSEEAKMIADILDGTENKIAITETQKAKYTLLKSGLMDDLLTGRVRVTSLLEAAETTVDHAP